MEDKLTAILVSEAVQDVYLEAINSCLKGDLKAADRNLAALGCNWRLSSAVWAAAANTHKQQQQQELPPRPSPCLVHDGLLPPAVLAALQAAFHARDSDFWQQHRYGEDSCPAHDPGYYSSGGRRARCIKCANGYSTSGTGATQCTVGLCQPGTGGPNCQACPAGSWSPGRPRGQDCSPCPVFKLKECYYSTGCDPVKGVQVLKQPAGYPCGVNGSGKCDGQGTCNDPASANCAAGTGGPDCSPCPEGTFSPGQPRGEQCVPCPMVKLMECYYSNGCDPVKGIEILKRKAGYPCRDGKGTCDGNGSCVCSAGSGGWDCEACPIFTWSPGLPQEQACKKCDPPKVMCKRMQRPCDIEPPCDTSTGEQTSMCWVTAPDGWPCQLLDGTDNTGKCKAGECLA